MPIATLMVSAFFVAFSAIASNNAVTVLQTPKQASPGDAVFLEINTSQTSTSTHCYLKSPSIQFQQLTESTFWFVLPAETRTKLHASVYCEDTKGKSAPTIGVFPILWKPRVQPLVKLSVHPDTVDLPLKDQQKLVAFQDLRQKYLDWSFPDFIDKNAAAAMYKNGLNLPAKGRLTASYMQPRIYNRTKKSFHTGVDISVPNGAEIRNPLAGFVVFVGDSPLHGFSIVIHHGSGLSSSYSHLSKALVTPGTWLQEGDLMGLSGQSGRATGPHLHWEAYWHGHTFNPLSLVRTQEETPHSSLVQLTPLEPY